MHVAARALAGLAGALCAPRLMAATATAWTARAGLTAAALAAFGASVACWHGGAWRFGGPGALSYLGAFTAVEPAVAALWLLPADAGVAFPATALHAVALFVAAWFADAGFAGRAHAAQAVARTLLAAGAAALVHPPPRAAACLCASAVAGCVADAAADARLWAELRAERARLRRAERVDA